jgi:hypothetical protein
MDPVAMIVTALATGAASALKPAAEKAVKDAYDGIKALIQRKYGRVSVDMLENDPSSQSRQNIVQEDLKKADAGNDKEVLHQAEILLNAIKRYDPEAAQVIGVNLADFKSASVDLEDIASAGTGVKIARADISGDIKIKGVRAGRTESPQSPPPVRQ